MKVAVIGPGNMGGGLARTHEVAIGSRDKARSASRAKELGAMSGGGNADAAGYAEVIILAGDDANAKEIVAQLARDAVYDPIDCGELVAARDLERLLGLFGAISHSLEWGSWSLKVLRR